MGIYDLTSLSILHGRSYIQGEENCQIVNLKNNKSKIPLTRGLLNIRAAILNALLANETLCEIS